MEDKDQILIERYLAGELTESERHEVEQRKKDDPLFLKEVISYGMAKEALRLQQREELRRRFVARDLVLDKKKPESTTPGKKRFIWIWVAGAIIILGLWMWKYLFTAGHEVNPVPVVTDDSLRMEQTQPVQQDTQGTEGSEVKEKTPEKDLKSNRQKPPMADAVKKNEELFAAYFEPYKDAMMDPTTRGESEVSPLEEFRKAYWDGKYQEVAGLFKKLDPAEQQNDNYRFQLANALLISGKEDEAIPVFESIIQNNRSKYVAEAYYGLGMGYLRKGDESRAKETLEKYVKLEKAKQKEQADEIILKLK